MKHHQHTPIHANQTKNLISSPKWNSVFLVYFPWCHKPSGPTTERNCLSGSTNQGSFDRSCAFWQSPSAPASYFLRAGLHSSSLVLHRNLVDSRANFTLFLLLRFFLGRDMRVLPTWPASRCRLKRSGPKAVLSICVLHRCMEIRLTPTTTAHWISLCLLARLYPIKYPESMPRLFLVHRPHFTDTTPRF